VVKFGTRNDPWVRGDLFQPKIFVLLFAVEGEVANIRSDLRHADDVPSKIAEHLIGRSRHGMAQLLSVSVFRITICQSLVQAGFCRTTHRHDGKTSSLDAWEVARTTTPVTDKGARLET
jgi:hypothetical protein